jgi:hypothetical protein
MHGGACMGIPVDFSVSWLSSPDSHIRGVNDLTRAGVRFISREFARRVGRLPGYDTAKARAPADLDAALDWVSRRPARRTAA